MERRDCQRGIRCRLRAGIPWWTTPSVASQGCPTQRRRDEPHAVPPSDGVVHQHGVAAAQVVHWGRASLGGGDRHTSRAFSCDRIRKQQPWGARAVWKIRIRGPASVSLPETDTRQAPRDHKNNGRKFVIMMLGLQKFVCCLANRRAIKCGRRVRRVERAGRRGRKRICV